MLQAPDADKFCQAELKELDGLQRADVFEFVKCQDIYPNTQFMQAVWLYRRKHRVDGIIYKHKACLCADGCHQKKGIHFNKVFAPVVSWSTVRLVLFLSNLLGLEGRQIDFVQAFTQADSDQDLYMEIPPNWDPPGLADKKEDFIMELKKNLYGSCSAAHNWWVHPHAGLLK